MLHEYTETGGPPSVGWSWLHFSGLFIKHRTAKRYGGSKGKASPTLNLVSEWRWKISLKTGLFSQVEPPLLLISIDLDSGLFSESVLCSQTPCLDGRPSALPVTWGRAIRRRQDNFAFKFCWWLWGCRMHQIQSSVLQAYQHSCFSWFFFYISL